MATEQEKGRLDGLPRKRAAAGEFVVLPRAGAVGIAGSLHLQREGYVKPRRGARPYLEDGADVGGELVVMVRSGETPVVWEGGVPSSEFTPGELAMLERVQVPPVMVGDTASPFVSAIVTTPASVAVGAKQARSAKKTETKKEDGNDAE